MCTNARAVLFAMACLGCLPNPARAAESQQSQSPPSAIVLEDNTVRGVLGRTVRDADGQVMGRVLDVIVDAAGHVRAAVIDFGGFLGVGSRKIAVDWNALEFGKAVKHGADLRLALTQDQLKAAPEYKEGNAVVVIGSTGQLETINRSAKTVPEQ